MIRQTIGCIVPALLAMACATNPSVTAEPVSLASTPSRFASLDGHRVHYKSVGRGREAIVLIHGWAGDMTLWNDNVTALSKTGRVVLIDLPGHGQSASPETTYSMDFFARSVDAVLRDAGVSRAVLVGHSMGTPVARQFYRRFPEKTRAIIAADGALRSLVTRQDQIDRFLAPLKTPQFKENFTRMFTGMTAESAPGVRERVMNVAAPVAQNVIVSAGEEMFNLSIWSPDPIGVPVLSILAKSPMWAGDYQDVVKRLAPGAEFRMMDGASHFLMMDRPDEFNQIVLDFLQRHDLD